MSKNTQQEIATPMNKVAKRSPVLRLPPTASAMPPPIEGPTAAPRSPANAKKANIAENTIALHFDAMTESYLAGYMAVANIKIGVLQKSLAKNGKETAEI
mgnify:CR=1 FL=1